MALAEIKIIPRDGVDNDKKVCIRVGGKMVMVSGKEAKGIVENLCVQFGWKIDYGNGNGG